MEVNYKMPEGRRNVDLSFYETNLTEKKQRKKNYKNCKEENWGRNMEIKNIQELIAPILKDGKKYKSHVQDKLLEVGENYGSRIVKLVIILEDIYGIKEEHNCVAKLVPLSPYIWKVFNVAVTFKKEIKMYSSIIPSLYQFGREHGVEDLVPFFGEYIGSRISLDSNSEEVDLDAVLVLRNLTPDGYFLCDRFVGFDKATTELLLKDLATMHAATIAFKIQKPKEFREKLLPYLTTGAVWDYDDTTLKKYQDQYASALRKYFDCSELIDKVVKSMRKAGSYYGSKPREPFATMVHQDLWTNNVLVKFQNNKPISSKLIDFQVMCYGNPASDVLFLLYSSTQIDLLHLLDNFVNIYFQKFISILTSLHCDTSTFTLDAFQQEMYAAATDFTFVQILFMLAPIYTLKGRAKDISEMTDHDDTVVPDQDLHENFFHRLHIVVKEFLKRGWIQS